MQLLGEWYTCNDGMVRPTIVLDIRAADRVVPGVRFVVDTGADRTVLTADLLPFLLPMADVPNTEGLGGVGGRVTFGTIRCELEFPRGGLPPVTVRGEYAALRELSIADMPIPGRDVTDHFDLVVSRRHGVVALLGGNHSFRVVGPPVR